jgi:hypothetical protein
MLIRLKKVNIQPNTARRLSVSGLHSENRKGSGGSVATKDSRKGSIALPSSEQRDSSLAPEAPFSARRFSRASVMLDANEIFLTSTNLAQNLVAEKADLENADLNTLQVKRHSDSGFDKSIAYNPEIDFVSNPELSFRGYSTPVRPLSALNKERNVSTAPLPQHLYPFNVTSTIRREANNSVDHSKVTQLEENVYRGHVDNTSDISEINMQAKAEKKKKKREAFYRETDAYINRSF